MQKILIKKINELNKENLILNIRKKIFPYTDTPFAEYVAMNNLFYINQIKSIVYDETQLNSQKILSTDTGIILFINEKIFINFILQYDYYKLIDSPGPINENYWSLISNNYKVTDLAIIVSPGIDVGVDFEGSGIFLVM